MLELDILLKPEQEVEVIHVLKSTEEGRIMYDALCERQLVLQQLVGHRLKARSAVSFTFSRSQ